MCDGWTQVTVFNVGMHATNAQLEKLLKKNGIAYKRARKPPSISHAILTFEVRPESDHDPNPLPCLLYTSPSPRD